MSMNHSIFSLINDDNGDGSRFLANNLTDTEAAQSLQQIVLENHETASDYGHEHEAHEQTKAAQLAIALAFCALLLGQLLKHITSYLKVPYTPFVTIAGLLIGFVSEKNQSGKSQEDWTIYDRCFD